MRKGITVLVVATLAGGALAQTADEHGSGAAGSRSARQPAGEAGSIEKVAEAFVARINGQTPKIAIGDAKVVDSLCRALKQDGGPVRPFGVAAIVAGENEGAVYTDTQFGKYGRAYTVWAELTRSVGQWQVKFWHVEGMIDFDKAVQEHLNKEDRKIIYRRTVDVVPPPNPYAQVATTRPTEMPGTNPTAKGSSIASQPGEMAARPSNTYPPRAMLKNTGAFGRAVFLNEGHTIVATSGEGQIAIWPLEEAHPTKVVTVDAPITCLAVSPDDHWAVTGSAANTATLIDLTTGEVVSRLPCDQSVTAVAFSPDSRVLVSADVGGVIRYYDAPRFARAREVRPGLSGGVRIIKPPVGMTFLAVGQSDKAALMDLAGRTLWTLQGHEHSANSEIQIVDAAFSRNGKWIATGGADGSVRLWDGRTGTQMAVLSPPVPNPSRMRGRQVASSQVRSVVFSPDGSLLAAAVGDGVRVWNVALRQETAALPGMAVQRVAFSPGGQHLAVGAKGKTTLWDLALGKEEAVLYAGEGTVRQQIFSSDGHLLLVLSDDRMLRVWDRPIGRQPTTRATMGIER